MELTKELLCRMVDAKSKFRAIARPTWKDLAETIDQVKFDYGCGYMTYPDNLGIEPVRYSDKPIEGYAVAYWVRGGSEGHWVHVHELNHSGGPSGFEISPIIFNLKFCGTDDEIEDAKEATNFILECCGMLNMW